MITGHKSGNAEEGLQKLPEQQSSGEIKLENPNFLRRDLQGKQI